MKNNSELFRSIVAYPFAATDKNGEIVDLEQLLDDLSNEVSLITDVAEMNITLENKSLVENFIENRKKKGLPNLNNAEIARRLEIVYPKEFYYPGKSGRSRVNKLFGARVISECKSWSERCKVLEGKSDKYVSQGWSRTAQSYKPRNLSPKINLGDVDSQYCKIEIVDNDTIILNLVIQGEWYKLYFDYNKRLKDADDIAKPSIYLDKKERIRFAFPAVYKYNFTHFSNRYIIGIDVGISNYVSLVVYDTVEKRIAFSSTLSQRVHSLSNKIKKTNIQISSLQRRGKKKEASLHRASNSRRKKELAILAAQEIAELSHLWDNSIVVFEDLSWIENTMQNGRWNRGELVKRTKEQVELNGGRVIKTSCYNTSQVCCNCGEKILFKDYHTVICRFCGIKQDRDINAAANIAQKILASKNSPKSCFEKMVATRNNKKNSKNKNVKRTKNGSGKTLKFPGRDRTKNVPTPKRIKRKEVKRFPQCSARNNEDSRVALDVSCSRNYRCMTVKSSTKVCNNTHCTLLRCNNCIII